MEHDDERRIREKVRLAEEIPQAWSKDRVWSAIRRKDNQPRKQMAIYYVAASLALVAALVFYSQELTYREELKLKIKGVELAIEQAQQRRESISNVQVAAVSLTECPEQPKEKVSRPLKARRETSMIANVENAEPIDQSTVAPIENPQGEQREIAKEQPTIVEPPSSPFAVTPTQVQVQPIIGGLASTPSTTKYKRFQLRFFQGDEEMKSSPTSTPLTTLAGINNR